MLRGTLVLFAGAFTVLILRRRLYLHHWLGMTLIVAGAALVGAASILYSGHHHVHPSAAPPLAPPGAMLGENWTGQVEVERASDSSWTVQGVVQRASGFGGGGDASVARKLVGWAGVWEGEEGGGGVPAAAASPLFGDCMVIAAQAFNALQFILEEKYLGQYRIQVRQYRQYMWQCTGQYSAHVCQHTHGGSHASLQLMWLCVIRLIRYSDIGCSVMLAPRQQRISHTEAPESQAWFNCFLRGVCLHGMQLFPTVSCVLLRAQPLLAVGIEGAWGVLLCAAALPLCTLIRTPLPGSGGIPVALDDAGQATHQLCDKLQQIRYLNRCCKVVFCVDFGLTCSCVACVHLFESRLSSGCLLHVRFNTRGPRQMHHFIAHVCDWL